ncbi:integrin alpha [Streptomyces sp. NPDC057638]|uniref:integrin alpha n=1 Tax=Streptomyces sp. NPDC057638 TaxID=3346190 RepID=UPI003676F17F
MGTVRRRRWATVVAVVCTGLATTVCLPGVAMAKPVAAPADFNGDGYQDLVVPAPTATVGRARGAGAVVVLYGSRTGVSPARRVVFTQDTPGVPDGAESQDLFGASTA